MIRVIRAWIQAFRPWPRLGDAPLGYVAGKPQPYTERRMGRWA